MNYYHNIARSVTKIITPQVVILTSNQIELERYFSFYSIKCIIIDLLKSENSLTQPALSSVLINLDTFTYKELSDDLSLIDSMFSYTSLVLIKLVDINHEDNVNMLFNNNGISIIHPDWTTADFGLGTYLLSREPKKNNDSLQVSKLIKQNSQFTFRNWWAYKYNNWLQSNMVTPEQIKSQIIDSKLKNFRPLISILLPIYHIDIDLLIHTLHSVFNQTYDNWELITVYEESEDNSVISYLKSRKIYESRMILVEIPKNNGISEASNIALQHANGEYVALLDHDDIISINALYEVVHVLNEYPFDFIFSDKEHINSRGEKLSPLFKPNWSLVTMISGNYVTHFNVIRKNILNKIGGFNSDTNGAQDWDIFLRVRMESKSFCRIPKVLYSWRMVPSSASMGSEVKPYVIESQIKVISRLIDSLELNATVSISNDVVKLNWKESQQKYYAFIYCDDNSIGKIRDTLKSIAMQSVIPISIYIVGEFNQDAFITDVLDYLPIKITSIICDELSISNTLMRTIAENFEYNSLIIKAGVTLISDDFVTECIPFLGIENACVCSGKLLDENLHILNAGYIAHPEGYLIEPFSGFTEPYWGTYGYSEWYREYISVQPSVLIVNPTEFLKGYYTISQKDRQNYKLQDLLIVIQLVLSQKGYRSIFNPYARSILHEDYKTSTINVMDIVNITDINYNPNVWDWNLDCYYKDVPAID